MWMLREIELHHSDKGCACEQELFHSKNKKLFSNSNISASHQAHALRNLNPNLFVLSVQDNNTNNTMPYVIIFIALTFRSFWTN